MTAVKIYTAISNASPKATEKKYGYVLECMMAGEAKTREGFGRITGTYHQASITAVTEALKRMKCPCEICICAEDGFFLNMLEKNLPGWVENEFRNSRGEQIANKEEWEQLWKVSKCHRIQEIQGKHEYTEWLQERMKKMPEQ